MQKAHRTMVTISLKTQKHGLEDITGLVEAVVDSSGVRSGQCCVFVPHTTAGLAVTSGADPLGLIDVDEAFKTLVPTRTDFHHQCDGPDDAAGHIKTVLAGPSVTLIVHEGKLVRGGSQSIYFFEFDGPRDRKCHIQVTGA